MALRLTLNLATEMLSRLVGYYVYRMEELEGNRPIVNGGYIQREKVRETSQSMTLVLDRHPVPAGDLLQRPEAASRRRPPA